MTFQRWCGVAALVCAISHGAGIATGQQTFGPWKIDYETTALAVEAVEKSSTPQPFTYTVTLRNTSGMRISAIGLSVGPHGTTTRVDLAPNAHDLAPGGTYTVGLLPRPEDLSGSLRVAAVLFSDGGGDGDPVFLQELRLSRLGDMLESARLLALLRSLGPFQVDDASLARIQHSLGPKPASVEDALSGLTIPSQAQRMLHEATSGALDAFNAAVAMRRNTCRTSLDMLANIPSLSIALRAERLSKLTVQYQGVAAALATAWNHDMGGLEK